ncbi:MAG: TonB-dependent receptor [Gammaproteobacteria bacterium]|nr:MAG: TonB-dependent receptor [Gammaproteobacteria bacterium]
MLKNRTLLEVHGFAFARPVKFLGSLLFLTSLSATGLAQVLAPKPSSVQAPPAVESNTVIPLLAQLTPPPTPPTPPAPPDASEATEVTVVGSRIRRTTFDSPSPLQVVTREDATAAGFNSTSDLLQSASVTGGASQINNSYGSYVTDGGPGANTISLRGLGAGRTLVLINGRRVAPAGTRGAVGSADLNVLPTSMVERVEILRDGASSIYGSDAIGGVVNVITKDKVDGLTIEGDFNLPTEGAGEQSRFSISGGKSDDRWSISGSLDYYERSNLTLGDRDWARCNSDGLRDPETRESLDYIDPKTGKSKCYTVSGTGSNGVTINTIGTQSISPDNYADFGLLAPPVGAPGTTTGIFTRFRPNAAITTGLVGYEGVGGGGNDINVRDTFDPRMLNTNLISPAKIFTAFVQGKYDLQTLGDAELYFEMLSHHRSSQQTDFRQLSLDYRYGSPLIPANLGFADFAPDQGTSDGNDVGVRAFIGFGSDHSEQTLRFNKPTVGIKGDITFLPDWKYDAYVSYSKSDADYRMQSFLTDKLTYSTDAVAAPAGIDAALVRDGLTCQINITNPEEKCIVAPMLTAATIGGTLPQDFKNYVFRDVVGNTAYSEAVYSATIDGPLYTLPAGKIQGVLGVEHRRAKINDQPNENSISGNLYNLTSAAPTVGKDNVTEVFTEIEVPLLAKVPFAEELTLNGSYRYTDYDSYGSDTTYKVGLVYSPTTWLSLRGTKGTSFRAPALFEQYQGATSGFLQSSEDPCNDYGEKGDILAANCASELPGQPTFQATQGIETTDVGGAAAGLYAETSENITYGIIVQPALGDSTELSFAMDYFDIKIKNGVSQAGAEEILKRCYESPEFHSGGGLCRLVSRDPTTTQLFVSDSFTNLSTENSRGVDFSARFQQDVGPGKLLVDLNTTRYYSQSNKIFKEDELKEENGWIEAPEWSGTADISYSINAYRFSYGIEWIGPMDGYTYAEEDPADSVFDFKTPSYLTHRISARYEAETWEATLGVRNLTNEIPPTISALVYDRVGNSPLYSGYDYVGRQVFVNVAVHF